MTAPRTADPAAALDLIVGMLADRLADRLAPQLAERLGVSGGTAANEKPMTLQEAATWSRISQRTIRRLIAAGDVKRHGVGRRVLVMREDLLRVMQRDGTATQPTTSSDAQRIAEKLLRRVK